MDQATRRGQAGKEPLLETVEEILLWIESLADDPETHRLNIIRFNREIRRLIACGEPVVEILISRMVGTKKRWMKWATIWALREIGDRRAVEPLWEVLERTTEDLGIRYELLLALSKFSDVRIFDILVDILDGSDLRKASFAPVPLGNLGDARAVAPLMKLFRQSNTAAASDTLPPEDLKYAQVHTKQAIIQALGKIDGETSARALEEIIDYRILDSAAFAHFDRLRCDAVKALSNNAHPHARQVLRDALHHQCRGVRRKAQRVLDGLHPGTP